jgi:hypothetical protein
MRKIYYNLTGIAFSAILCLGITLPASAQRGGEHSDGKTTTPPPAAVPSRPAPQPAPQQQVQRPAPQQQQPQQQVQRQAPQQQQQQQVQRPAPQQQQQTTQRSNPQQQTNGYGQRNPNAVGSGSAVQQRGQQHQTQPYYPPGNASNGSRRYPYVGQRGNSSYNPKANSFNYNHGSGYRSYPGLRFGRNYTSPRPGGFYYRNRGYYSTYYTPQLGFRLSVLPYGYYPFYFGQDQYYYNDGLYYRQQDNEYTVVEPPVGASIDRLPAKAQAIAINGMQYYELNGVYYQPITRDNGSLTYQIAGKDGELTTDDATATTSPDDLPQVGDLVDNLPEGCKIIRLANQKFYVSQEGYYFQDAVDTNGDKVFKIVGTPTDAPGN